MPSLCVLKVMLLFSCKMFILIIGCRHYGFTKNEKEVLIKSLTMFLSYCTRI